MLNYSVALCMYNGEKYIKDQLDSIIHQVIPPSEIIICDDCSNDNGLIVADELLTKSNIKYKIVGNKANMGVSNNFVKAMKLCSYDYIFTSDQDDLWRKDKSAIALRIFESNPSIELFFSDGSLVDADNSDLGRSIWDSIGITEKMLIDRKWFDHMLPKHIVTGATMAVKKSLVNGIEAIPEGFLHDDWIAWKAAIRDTIYACPEKLIRYRQHSSNVVGMKTNHLSEKISNWFSYLGSMQRVRSERVKRFLALEEGFKDILSCEQKEKLDLCLQFWNEALLLDSINKLDAIKWIIKNEMKGNYSHYYNGKKSAFRDIIDVLI